MKKNYFWGTVALLLVASLSFYGGMSYGQSSAPSGRGLPQNAGQYAAGSARGGAFRSGGSVTSGQIIAKDSSSITLKMQDGSTIFVLTGTTTPVMKTSAGTLGDLSVGETVTVLGTPNSDGSMTAQTIQIRPSTG